MGTRLPITRSALANALATILATITSFAIVYVLCRWADARSYGPAIAAAVFALAYGRRRAAHGNRHPVLGLLVIACVALGAFGIGYLLLRAPIAGAVVFVGGLFFSVYARNYTGPIRQIGAVIALPLITVLIVPATPAHAAGGPLVDIILSASAGIVSLVMITVMRTLLERLGIQQTAFLPEPAAPVKRAGMTPATRMALQMAVALTAAFTLGFLLFPAHWGWMVLTAFIVCSGARGRGDAAYKGLLRLAGALGGTIIAAVGVRLWTPSGPAEAAVIFALLFIALVLRESNYAYWAAGTTLVLALLSRSADSLDLALLGIRLEAILAGAVCAVLAAWFVFPIRTEDVIRRRLADALKALDDVVVHAHDASGRNDHVAHFAYRMHELGGVAPPVRWHRRIFVRADAPEHPARWIDLAQDIAQHANRVADGAVTDDKTRGRLRRAIGISRRAIGQHRDPDAEGRVPIGVALVDLRDTIVTVNASLPDAR